MRKKVLLYGGFAVVCLAVFYIALFAGNDYWKPKLPILSDVKPFRFVNQLGDTVTERSIDGKVCVVSFFFTTCQGICPRMNTNIKTEIYDTYKDQPDFLVISHTVDPDRDDVARMKVYADSLGADPSHWWFLTGSKSALYYAARHSYLLDNEADNKEKIEDQFIHTQLFALVDKKGQVRGTYDGLNQAELDKLKKDIKNLLQP